MEHTQRMTGVPICRVRSHVVKTDLSEEESVVLDLKTRRYYSLNETATFLWNLLDGGSRPDEMAAALQRDWEVTEEEARHEVATLIADLLRQGLIEEVNDRPE